MHHITQVMGALRQTAKGWFMVPVGMLTTQQREYVALHKAAGTEVRCCHISRIQAWFISS